MNDVTPLMAQYRKIKTSHSDCILLFRVGDFYETFFEDAIDIAKVLNIALTTRDKSKPNPIPLAGVPFHAAENYITRLLAAGRKVAICEQVEDPATARGLVKRQVVEVLTPGTALNRQLLDSRENNFCLAIHLHASRAGIALIDVSTGDLLVGEDEITQAHHLIQGKRVREVVHKKGMANEVIAPLVEALDNPFIAETDAAFFDDVSVKQSLEKQFDSDALAHLGPLERVAGGALLAHCHSLRGGVLPQVVTIKHLAKLPVLALDDETIRNLELFRPLPGGDTTATLIRVIDQTVTPMGGREIRAWLQRPLCHVELIDQRLEAVAEIYGDAGRHERMVSILKGIRDTQRIAARIASRKAIPREFHALRESLERVPELDDALADCGAVFVCNARTMIRDHRALVERLERAIVDDPPGHLREGGVIRKGYAPELDQLITQSEEAKRWIADLEKHERKRSGIGSLKVGYNRVFGYYIEVSKANVGSVPSDYVAKQTLVNAERFFTKALKDREQVILENEDKRIRCEQENYEHLCDIVANSLPDLQATSQAVAQIDVIQSLAAVAKRHRFRRPIVDDSKVIDLKASRHPVLENVVKEPFVPNDLHLDLELKQFALITGPNMSGKSTFLRQVALVVVLAQMGSFVPAGRARIGLVDSIFTRVGAGDRLSRGESTFLVEMKETAKILDQMSDRSLVLLDEVGRGTSTYDGLSIAWAVTEYLLQGIAARPKTLFATHFHELTQLRNDYPRLVNLKITIREWEGGVVFLRKIVPGTSDRSYGIHAARVAGLPAQVLKRAEEILQSLELRRNLLQRGVSLSDETGNQFSLFNASSAPPPPLTDNAEMRDIKARIRSFDINKSTPLEALQLLKTLQDKLAR
ncbi:MAG: DNA mismatch repair protein MutS [Candidatus Krumholzibacteria bacterium]|nr:DNA mismatch repair protein MutS [Candidatus Krumholzibacteria bacterium]